MPPHPPPKPCLTDPMLSRPPRRHSPSQATHAGADRRRWRDEKPGLASKTRVPERPCLQSCAPRLQLSPSRRAAADWPDRRTALRASGGRSPKRQALCPRPAALWGQPGNGEKAGRKSLELIAVRRCTLRARQQACSVGFRASSCQSLGFCRKSQTLPMDGCRSGNAILSTNRSQYISVYFKIIRFRYHIVARLWLNHGRSARFSILPAQSDAPVWIVSARTGASIPTPLPRTFSEAFCV